MDEFLAGLNAAQRSAVTSPASVLQVLAPPGSGKTKTLTARVAYLITHEQLQPWNIIVCTFTNKAAREMQERIRGLVGDNIGNKLILGTFHRVARRFLNEYGQTIGIEKNFGVADTDDSNAIIKRIIQRHSYTLDPKNARSRISGLKSKSITADGYAASIKKVEDHELANIYKEYEGALEASNLLDFDDLLLRCTELLRRHPECVANIQAVLIDEFQDTNHVQYNLMSLFAQRMRRITIVGDPDQSIYGWRSADIKNLTKMRTDYKETIVINLENNYRSSACILSSSLAVIEQDESRPSKPLLPTHCVGERPVLRHLISAAIESRWIVEELQRSKILTAGLLSFNDYAILLRSSALSLSIERALGQAGIPYRMIGGRRFFDRSEIKIVLDYLRVINQPEHSDALARIINVPARKIGDPTVKSLLEEAESEKTSLWSLLLSSAQGGKRPKTKISNQAQKGIDELVHLILSSRRKYINLGEEQCSLLELIDYVLKKLSFEAYLKTKHSENWKDRWANVEELVCQATQMADTSEEDESLPAVDGIEQRPPSAADTLARFLGNVALSTSLEESPDGEQPNQVTISTIHAAKGLEWPVVFIPAVYEGSIPHSRNEDMDEERRLLYVGMTRAQGLLYLSCPVRQVGQEETTLSRFISPRNIQKFFDLRGPTFSFSVVQDLSGILRRPCPTPRDVDGALDLLERTEDDKYPANRNEIEGDDDKWGSGYDYKASVSAKPFKRRKIESMAAVTDIGVPVTVNVTNTYSISSTTMTSGFMSASDLHTHHQTLQQSENSRMLATASQMEGVRATQRVQLKSKITSTKVSTASSTRAKPVKKRPSGQGSITAFFSKPAPTMKEKGPEKAPDEPPLPLPLAAPLFRPQVPLKDISNAPTNRDRGSDVYSSKSFPDRKPRNAPMLGKPKRVEHSPNLGAKRYVLLSSSPVKADDHCYTTSKGDLSDEEADILSPSKPSAPAPAIGSGGFQPASTFHATTVSQIQSRSIPRGSVLGLGRNTQGWVVKNQHTPRPKKLG